MGTLIVSLCACASGGGQGGLLRGGLLEQLHAGYEEAEQEGGGEETRVGARRQWRKGLYCERPLSLRCEAVHERRGPKIWVVAHRCVFPSLNVTTMSTYKQGYSIDRRYTVIFNACASFPIAWCTMLEQPYISALANIQGHQVMLSRLQHVPSSAVKQHCQAALSRRPSRAGKGQEALGSVTEGCPSP